MKLGGGVMKQYKETLAQSFGKVMLRQRLYRGFSMVELIMVLVIVGILAAVVAPRFTDTNIFQAHGFADQVQASLRDAQKVAIAQRRFVCVAFTSTSVSLTMGETAACGTTLNSLSDGAAYVINAPAGINFIAVPNAFNFNALGAPSFANNQIINVTNITSSITVEAGTGYVHSP